MEKLMLISEPIQLPALSTGRLADMTDGGAAEVVGDTEEVVGGIAEMVGDTVEVVGEEDGVVRGVNGIAEGLGEVVRDWGETLDRNDWQLVSNSKIRQRPESNCDNLVINIA
jgi:hypothetical protein